MTRLTAALAGRYRIERELGQGGMATVYLAEDLKHDRKVAIKVLKPELAAVLGAERFVQEIKTTAALSHPHILPLFDSGEAGGYLYYVMPYIQGETIREKLNRETQFGIDEAVRITSEIADALDYAHRHGVIHRDIKPENILLHDGRPMVMDFGIALALSAAAGGRMTETGLSLGTPHYMSPEQATADKAITARSDVYSLASVLYEMLAGNPPHVGSSAHQIIMKIIAERAQPVTDLRGSVPANVAAALAKALEKLPADRFESAKAFAQALGEATFRHGDVAGIGAGETGLAPAWAWNRLSIALALLAAIFALAFGWGFLRPEAPRPVARYGLTLPAGQAPTGPVAVAPDGSWLVYTGPGSGAGATQLWLKARDRLEVTPLAGSAGAERPSVSSDGRWIAFVVAQQLRKIPAGGGEVTTVADSVGDPKVIWLDDGTLAYADLQLRVRRVPAAGGTSEVLFTPTGTQGAVPMAALPDSRGLLFVLCPSGACIPPLEIWATDGRSGEAKRLLAGHAWAEYDDGRLFFRRDGRVFGVSFDLGTLSLVGAPVPLFEADFAGNHSIALSASGSLVYSAGGAGGLQEAVWVSRDGRAVPVDTAWGFRTDMGLTGWSLSPDGTRLAINLSGSSGQDVWIKELDRGPLSRLTFSESMDIRPRWTPDGRSVTFLSNRAGDYDLYRQRADGTGADSLVLDLAATIFEAVGSPDGDWQVLRVGGGSPTDGVRDIVALKVGRDTLPRPLLTAPYDEKEPALSPDGRWLAYESMETGRREVFVRPFPDVEAGKWQISTAGGTSPVWAHSGRELFFVNGAREMVSQEVRPGPSFRRGGQQVLFSMTPYLEVYNYRSFDLSPDDQRFLMVRPQGEAAAAAPALVVVENWLEEVDRIMRGGSR